MEFRLNATRAAPTIAFASSHAARAAPVVNGRETPRLPTWYDANHSSRLGTVMSTITKKDLVDRISESTGGKRVLVKRIIQDFLDLIITELGRGNRLEFRDFGVFEIRERAARLAQNPKTMEKVRVPNKRTVKFKVGRLMKEKLQLGGGGMSSGVAVVQNSVNAAPQGETLVPAGTSQP